MTNNGSTWEIQIKPLRDQHGRLDANWSPLGDQNGSIGVIKIKPLGDLHGR